MTDFYYQVNDKGAAYRIDNISQQILIYLFSNGDARLERLVDKVGATSESDINMRIKEYIGPEAAELITQSRVNQTTIGDRDPPTYYQLTAEGEQIVMKNMANFSMPADFRELKGSIGEIRTDIIEVQNSMHRIDANKLNEQLSEIVERLGTIQKRLSNYE